MDTQGPSKRRLSWAGTPVRSALSSMMVTTALLVAPLIVASLPWALEMDTANCSAFSVSISSLISTLNLNSPRLKPLGTFTVTVPAVVSMDSMVTGLPTGNLKLFKRISACAPVMAAGFAPAPVNLSVTDMASEGTPLPGYAPGSDNFTVKVAVPPTPCSGFAGSAVSCTVVVSAVTLKTGPFMSSIMGQRTELRCESMMASPPLTSRIIISKVSLPSVKVSLNTAMGTAQEVCPLGMTTLRVAPAKSS